MDNFLMKPKVDFALKEIMTNEKARIGFLLAMLKIKPEDTRGFLYTDKMEFHIIELPKLPEEIREDSSDIELWAKFINVERKEEFDMLAQKNQYIESAYEHLQIISQDKEKRLEYEAREKAIRDYNQLIRRLKNEEKNRQGTGSRLMKNYFP